MSGKNIIKMPELKAMYEKLNFTNVTTYIQSGNVVFKTKKTPTENLQQLITGSIQKQFDFEIPVLVMEANELKNLIDSNPFLKDKRKNIACMHITFLASTPIQEHINKIASFTDLPNEFNIAPTALYLYCPNGYSRTKLTNTFLENKLKVVCTTRNWKTCCALVKITDN